MEKEVSEMPVGESFLYALFCMLVVLTVLAILWGIIRLFSAIIRLVEMQHRK